MQTNPMNILRASALAMVALALLGGPTGAAVETNARGNTSSSDFEKKFKAKQVASQIVVARVPENFDPSKNTTLTFRCGVRAVNDFVAEDGTLSSAGVKKIKGNWSTKLLVVDEGAGTVESVELGSGKFRTDATGGAGWSATIATDAFADGFPQATSALAHGEVRYTKNKKVNILDLSCVIVFSS